MSSHDLNSQILKTLECISCQKVMSGKIFECFKGHNLCNCCWKENVKCPKCKVGFMDTRNGALEAIAQLVSTQCPNENLGCHKIVKLSEKEDHVQNCCYRNYKCKLDKNCDWTGYQNEIKKHCLFYHETQVLIGEEYTCAWKEIDTRHSVYLMLAHGENFIVHRKLLDHIMYWTVQYVGRSEDINLYYYEIEIFTDQFVNRKIKFSELCYDDIKDEIGEILESGFCVAIPYHVLETYLNEESVVYFKISIMRA